MDLVESSLIGKTEAGNHLFKLRRQLHMAVDAQQIAVGNQAGRYARDYGHIPGCLSEPG